MSARNNFQPFAGLVVTLLTRRGAETWTRHAYNVAPGVGLGWKPYTVLVTDHAVSYKAFYSVRELKRWMGGRFKLRLKRSPGRKPWSVAVGTLEVLS